MAQTFVSLWNRRQRVLRSGLRAVDVTCDQCGTPRTLWFKLGSFDPN